MSTATRLDIAAGWLRRLQTNPNDEALVAEWADWCRADPENLATFEGIEAVWAALDVPRTRALLQPRHWRQRMMRPALAAAILLAVMTAFWLSQPIGGTFMITKIAEHDSHTLADGSRIDLGARTRILASYSESKRRITVESGEAFFEVAKDPGRPFIVKSGDLRIIALGTAFSVRHSGGRTLVAVTDGKVAIASSAGLLGREENDRTMLLPGQQITFDEASRVFKLAKVDPENAVAWRNGILKFVGEPLGTVIEDVNRYSQRQISLEDSTLRSRLYTGTVYRGRIDNWLDAMDEVFLLEAVENGDEISLVRRK